MGTVIRLLSDNYRFIVKEAAELMFVKMIYIVSQLYHEIFEKRVFSKEFKKEISVTINAYAERFFRTISFLYKDFSCWLPADAKKLDDDKNMADFNNIFHDIIWIGVIGIRDSFRSQITDTI
jgi:Ca2+-transporting ATPase